MQQVSNRDIVRIANATIQPANGKDLTKYRNGDTGDIIQETIDCYRDCVNDVRNFAPFLKSNTLINTCFNVWQFVKSNIGYKMDPPKVQWVRTPARLWNDKEGDCKSYAVTIACILHQLGINGVLRFVSFNALNPTPTHVYVVVPDGNNEIKIDAVLNGFNIEKPYFFKQDYPMTQISRLSGVSDTTDNSQALKRLIFEREVERAKGTLTLDRATKYNRLIDSLRNGNSINGGAFGIGEDKLRQQMNAFLAQYPASFLYLFLPTGQPHQGQDHGMNTAPGIPGLPQIVLDKKQKAFSTAWNWGDPTGLDTVTQIWPAIRNAVAAKIGMQPEAYWSKALNLIVPVPSVGDSTGLITTSANIILPGSGTAINVAKGLLSSFVPDLTWTYPPDSFTPDISDWQGSKWANTFTNQPGQSLTQMAPGTNTATTAGMNMWVTLALVGAGLYFVTKK
ncbi:MAG: hypothetical protein Q8L07_04205 [Sediminibacterium sp.]|nr:hypothetical protein [Sediminibacterium sp.]